MGFFFIRMLKEPKYYKLLMGELDALEVNEEELLEYDQLKNLKWFDALIKENMRFDLVASGSCYWSFELKYQARCLGLRTRTV